MTSIFANQAVRRGRQDGEDVSFPRTSALTSQTTSRVASWTAGESAEFTFRSPNPLILSKATEEQGTPSPARKKHDSAHTDSNSADTKAARTQTAFDLPEHLAADDSFIGLDSEVYPFGESSNGKLPDTENRSWATVLDGESSDEGTAAMLDGENLGDDSSDWVDESANNSPLEEANQQFGLMSLSKPQDQHPTSSSPAMEASGGSHIIKPLPRDASSIPNWLLTHLDSGPKAEPSISVGHDKAPIQSLVRSDTVPRWMLPHIRRNNTDTEAPLQPAQPAQPPSTLKRKPVSWAKNALQDHFSRTAPYTPRFDLQNPNTPFHHRSKNSLLQPSNPVPDQEEANLIERLGQAAENRDRNYTGAEGRRIEWEDRRRMSEEVEGWDVEVKQALEAREKGGPVAQWVKKEMRDKARGLWRKVKGKN